MQDNGVEPKRNGMELLSSAVVKLSFAMEQL